MSALTLVFCISVGAEGVVRPADTSSSMEGVLVVDVSKSMLTSDPDKISNEAMKMFIDMASIKGDKIGVVAYSDEVRSKKELVTIRTEQDKKELKSFIDSLQKYPATDISVGVKEAVNVLNKSHEKGYLPLIVLLADGNNDLIANKGKTLKKAEDDLAGTVADAKAKGYPIYVIGLNANGKLNKEVLKNIASTTNGKFFETSHAHDLPGILSEIFANHLKLKVVPIKDVVAKQEYQNINIKIPNENVLEANISLISKKPVELKLVDPSGKEQTLPSDKILLLKSKKYSILKLLNPVQGDWTLKVKGFPKDMIEINLVFNNDLQLKLAPLSKELEAGDSIKFSAFFEDNGKQITNKEIYRTMEATLFVKDLDTGKSEEVPLDAQDNGFTGEYKIGDGANYEVMVKAESNSFLSETQPQKITIQRNAAEPSNEDVNAPSLKQSQLYPWLYIVITIVGAILLLTPIVTFISKRRKESRGFSGQIVIEIEDADADTDAAMEPQIKKLKDFKGEFCLNQLFTLESEFKETDQITFVPITDNTLLVLNKSNYPIELGEEVIDAETGHRLRRNDKLRIRLNELNKCIYIKNVS
jgi:Ca-activated chloride channel homolog